MKKVFICYSRRDSFYRDELIATLTPLKRKNLIDTWSDQEIEAGEKWKEKIDKELRSCNIAILLVSRHFLDSEFIFTEELSTFLERKRQEQNFQLIPIIVSPCLWEDEEFSIYQSVPEKAISKYVDQNDAWLEISEAIKKIANTPVNNKPDYHQDKNKDKDKSTICAHLENDNFPLAMNIFTKNLYGGKYKHNKHNAKEDIDLLLDWLDSHSNDIYDEDRLCLYYHEYLSGNKPKSKLLSNMSSLAIRNNKNPCFFGGLHIFNLLENNEFGIADDNLLLIKSNGIETLEEKKIIELLEIAINLRRSNYSYEACEHQLAKLDCLPEFSELFIEIKKREIFKRIYEHMRRDKEASNIETHINYLKNKIDMPFSNIDHVW